MTFVASRICSKRARLATACGVLAAQRRVVFALALRVGQAEHGLGQLVEQILRLLGKLAGGELAHVRVHRAVVLADLGRVVLELFQPQQLIMVQRPGRFGDLQPVAINVERLGHGEDNGPIGFVNRCGPPRGRLNDFTSQSGR